MTAKLSRLFYERLGEQIANELVEWFNSVDTAYRADLREFNELNFARFDAKLEQRLSDLRLEFRGELSDLRAEMRTGIAAVRADVGAVKADMIKWMFLFWAGSALGGLLLR